MVEVPLSLVAPVRVSSQTPVGILLPYKPDEAAMFSFLWDDEPHLLQLGGNEAFKYYKLQPTYVARGVLINDIEFRVDLTSRVDALNAGSPVGSLIIEGGKTFIYGLRAGDPFDDGSAITLGMPINAWGTSEKVAFSRWSISARHGENGILLWPGIKLEADKKVQ